MSITVRATASRSISMIVTPKIAKFYFKRNTLSFKARLQDGSETTVNVKLAGLFDRVFRKTQVVTLGKHSIRFTERSLTREWPNETEVNLAQKVVFYKIN